MTARASRIVRVGSSLLWILAACQGETAGSRDAGPDVSAVLDAGPDAPPEAPVTMPVGYRPCRDRVRDPEGGFCDATDLWHMRADFAASRSGAITIADLNRDGIPEVLITVQDGSPATVLTARLGFWEDVSTTWGLSPYRSPFSAGVADFDGDGDPDMVLGLESGASMLLRNTGTTFERVMSLGEAGQLVASWLIWDVDQDGMLDLIAGVERQDGDCPNPFGIPGCPGFIAAWRQVAPWSFRPMPVTAPRRRVQGLRMHDWTGDGRDELLVTSDIGTYDGGSLLLRVELTPEGFALRDATAGSGFDHELYGMGMGLIDIDEDGRNEVVLTNIGHDVVLTGRQGLSRDVNLQLTRDCYGMVIPGEMPTFRYFDHENPRERAWGRFQDMYFDQRSPRFPTTKWAPVVFDYDADGHEDMYIPAGSVHTGPIFPEPDVQASVLMQGTGGRMLDVTDTLFLRERMNARGAAAADLDLDGDLDLAVFHTGEGSQSSGLRVLRNDTQGGHLLAVVARGQGSVRDGIGAQVEVRVGSRTLRRRIDGNLSLYGTAPHEVYVGLGDATMADEVVVRFPSGHTSRRERVPFGRVVIEE